MQPDHTLRPQTTVVPHIPLGNCNPHFFCCSAENLHRSQRNAIPALSLRANCQRCESVVLTNFQGSACVSSADLVKTPEAKPNVVLLALASTSSSVSKGSTDMTGPKISSFTQVMSSLQSSASGGGNRQDCTRCTPGPNIDVIVRLCIVTYQAHKVPYSSPLSIWGHWGQEALLHKALWLPWKNRHSSKMIMTTGKKYE